MLRTTNADPMWDDCLLPVGAATGSSGATDGGGRSVTVVVVPTVEVVARVLVGRGRVVGGSVACVVGGSVTGGSVVGGSVVGSVGSVEVCAPAGAAVITTSRRRSAAP